MHPRWSYYIFWLKILPCKRRYHNKDRPPYALSIPFVRLVHLFYHPVAQIRVLSTSNSHNHVNNILFTSTIPHCVYLYRHDMWLGIQCDCCLIADIPGIWISFPSTPCPYWGILDQCQVQYAMFSSTCKA